MRSKNKKNHYETFLPQIKGQGVLLHTCCAPCAVEAVERMKSTNVSPHLYFYNPNIFNENEYWKRLEEVRKLAQFYKTPLIEEKYEPQKFLCAVKGLENEPEKGKRCSVCFEMRLKRLKNYAQNNDFKWTSSVLGVSRWKDFTQTQEAGIQAFLNEVGIKYLPINWRKGGSEEKRLKLIKEQNIYEQNYCGCPFSKREISS